MHADYRLDGRETLMCLTSEAGQNERFRKRREGSGNLGVRKRRVGASASVPAAAAGPAKAVEVGGNQEREWQIAVFRAKGCGQKEDPWGPNALDVNSVCRLDRSVALGCWLLLEGWGFHIN